MPRHSRWHLIGRGLLLTAFVAGSYCVRVAAAQQGASGGNSAEQSKPSDADVVQKALGILEAGQPSRGGGARGGLGGGTPPGGVPPPPTPRSAPRFHGRTPAPPAPAAARRALPKATAAAPPQPATRPVAF